MIPSFTPLNFKSNDHFSQSEHFQLHMTTHSALRSIQSLSYWKDHKPAWSQKASESKNGRLELQKTAKNQSKLVVTGLGMNTIKCVLYRQK